MTLFFLNSIHNQFPYCQAPGPVPGLSQHSCSKERTWIDTKIKQATTTKLFKGGNLGFLNCDCSKFQRKDQFNTVVKQARPPPETENLLLDH